MITPAEIMKKRAQECQRLLQAEMGRVTEFLEDVLPRLYHPGRQFVVHVRFSNKIAAHDAFIDILITDLVRSGWFCWKACRSARDTPDLWEYDLILCDQAPVLEVA